MTLYNKVYLGKLANENSQNVHFMPRLKHHHIHKFMCFETNDLIGHALQQEPVSEHLSYVFGIYRWFWLNVVKMGKYLAD